MKTTRQPLNGYVLPDAKPQQRGKVYLIYRDMGVSRSITRLERLLREKHPKLRVARPSLERWSVHHDWSAKLKAHDDAGGSARIARPT